MRLIGTLAVVTGMLVLASSCSENGGGVTPPENEAPVANFAMSSCVINIPCGFTSTSSDDAEVTKWKWDMDGDGLADGEAATASFMYTAAGDFNVSLTVWDAQGLSNTKTSTLTIDAVPVPPVNTPPTAAFNVVCAAADCTFTSTSTDEGGSIAAYAWNFGDEGTADVNNPTHSYVVTAPTDFTVTLTVTDNEGATDVETKTVSVTPPIPVNPAPVAGFTQWCYGADCLFFSTSTDAAPGKIVSYAWTFSDGGTADWNTPFHTFAVTSRTTFTATLTVTDDEGATASTTQNVTVAPLSPAVQGCTTSGKIVECVLDIPSKSTLKVKLLGVSCDLKRNPPNRITTPPPIGDQMLLSVCWMTPGAPGTEIGIFGGKLDKLWEYPAGTQARIWFTQGVPNNVGDLLDPPAGQLTGTFPDWTLSFEDGDHPGAEGEPDFTDVVVGVHATVIP